MKETSKGTKLIFQEEWHASLVLGWARAIALSEKGSWLQFHSETELSFFFSFDLTTCYSSSLKKIGSFLFTFRVDYWAASFFFIFILPGSDHQVWLRTWGGLPTNWVGHCNRKAAPWWLGGSRWGMFTGRVQMRGTESEPFIESWFRFLSTAVVDFRHARMAWYL